MAADADQLVTQHLDLARRAVDRASSRLPAHVSRDDLYAAALVGLVGAARAFDPARGIEFRAYASRRLDGAILDELRASDPVSRRIRQRARQYDSVTATLAAQLGRTPTVGEVAEAAGTSVDAVERVRGTVALAAPMRLETGIDVADATSPDDQSESERLIPMAVQALPDRLRFVIQGIYFQRRTAVDIADELGISPARVLQLRSEALVLLGDAFGTSAPRLRSNHLPSGRRRQAYRETLRRLSDAASPRPAAS